jgi:uncharacterized protein YggE
MAMRSEAKADITTPIESGVLKVVVSVEARFSFAPKP